MCREDISFLRVHAASRLLTTEQQRMGFPSAHRDWIQILSVLEGLITVSSLLPSTVRSLLVQGGLPGASWMGSWGRFWAGCLAR